MKKLRLLVTKDCNRHCKGCCNKDWNLDKLPNCKSYKGYDEIILTGGEPLLLDMMVLKLLFLDISKTMKSTAKVYLYTAMTHKITKILNVLYNIHGITLTLHSQKDVKSFIKLNRALKRTNVFKHRSMRLNVFKEVNLTGVDVSGWEVQSNMVWVKNCPLPKDEVFMKLEDV
jgi:organic radical activating enzyme